MKRQAIILLLMAVVTACSNFIIENSTQEKEQDEPITEITETSEATETTESTETAETTEPAEGENITDFPLDWRYYIVKTADSLYVIRNLDEFVQIFEKEPPTEIDFSRNSLLVAYGRTPSVGVSVKRTLIFEENRYVFNIDVTCGSLDLIGSWFASVLTPLLSANDEVSVNITYGHGVVPGVK